MSDVAIKIKNLKKEYRLGAIGGQTLNSELQSWWARKRGKEDPNLKIGESYSKTNKRFFALNGIDLEIKKGEAVGIIGSNGAGKSTLLKILSRVTAPTEGDIWIDGRISSMLEVGTGFHQELTGRENIYMNGAILGMTKKEVDEKIESIIDFSECREFIDTPVKRYSSGMYVKLAFAVASHLDSEIMIMDEVLAVGDMMFQKKCLNKMNGASKEGKTILYVSHNMSTIRELCTRCIVLKKGQIVFDGDCEEAIKIYLDANAKISKSYINNHKNDFNKTQSAQLISIEFKNKDKMEFFSDEKAIFETKLYCKTQIENLYLSAIISDTNLNRIGVYNINIKNIENGTKKYTFEISFDELPAGEYLIHFVVHKEDSAKNWYESLDETDNQCFLIMDREARLKWQKKWFGFVNFNKIKQLKSE